MKTSWNKGCISSKSSPSDMLKKIGKTIMAFSVALSLQHSVIAKENNQELNTLTIGSQAHLLPLNPFYTNETLSVHLLDLVFNKLVRLNSKGTIEPDLAESWTISEDGKEYKFNLKDNIYFHDKSSFTSKDIVASYMLFNSKEVASPYAYLFNKVEKVYSLSEKEVVFQLKESFPPFLNELKQFYIVPSSLIENFNIKDIHDFGMQPIGTGPFILKSMTGRKEILLEKYPDYHEPILVDQINVISFGSVNDTWVALMKGEVDLILYLNLEDFKIVNKDNTFKTYSVPNSSFSYVIAYNQKDSLLSKEMRTAISQAINRDEIIDFAFEGYGSKSFGPFIFEDSNKESLNRWDYNPNEAIAALNRLGWNDNNYDGVLDKDGEDLELSLMYFSDFDSRKKMALVLRQQLQEVGIKIKLIEVKDIENVGNSLIENGEFQLELRTLKSHYEASQSILDWHSKIGKLPNYYSYNLPELDSYIEQAYSEMDLKKKEKAFRQASDLIQEEQPFTFLIHRNNFHAVRNRFEKMDSFFSFYLPFYKLKDWAQSTTAQ